MKKIILSFLILFPLFVSAQELRCNVSVSSSSIEGSYKQVFESMRKDIYEFMNNRQWTPHVYDVDERIECNIFIQLTEMSGSDQFSGTIQVQSRRPVHNSSYETTILNIKDEDFDVRYTEYQPIEFVENSKGEALSNILAYYAYIILGFDYDTFSPSGGQFYFQKAKTIVDRSSSASEKGWKSYESDYNRYWLVENILNRSYSGYRDLIYRYHRKGLDVMSDKVVTGRSEIADALKQIQKVDRTRSSIYITRMFFDAKSDEIINIFGEGTQDEKNRVVQILTEVDPSNASKYENISSE